VTAEELALAASSAVARVPPVLHICRERDVGLFSLIQQVIANIPWALREGRVPVIAFGDRTCYWTPAGFEGGSSVWEYYFEPIVDGFPSAAIPAKASAAIERRFPDQANPGYFIDDHTFVSNHFGDHPSLRGRALVIPYETGNPDPELRRLASEVIRAFVRPRRHVERKVDAFFGARMKGRKVVGVHARGTDAVSTSEKRQYRRGSLDLERFADQIRRLLIGQAGAKVLVATDAEATLSYLVDAFGDHVIAYDAVRHEHGEPAGQGPTGCIMPAYVAADRERAAQNGEDAVVEYLLLSRCHHLIHNGASLATTVLLACPQMPDTNTHCRG
jgi:hypothetical protein